MKIIPYSQAKKIIDQGGHHTARYDFGKYEWTGTLRDYVGREVRYICGVYAVYPAKRKDKNGPYVALMAVCD